jgi:hypothetical protein
MERLSVHGFGRVGSRASAIRGGYMRSRQYWAVTRWSGTLVDPGDPHSSFVGYVEAEEYGRFKTRREAEARLAEIATGEAEKNS